MPVLPHHPPRVRQTSLNDCSARMADRNTRLGRRLGEHVAAVGGYSVCVVVGGHPVEGLPRLRVQRHDSTQHDPSARRTVRCRIAAEDDLGVRRVIRQFWIAIEPACRRLFAAPLEDAVASGRSEGSRSSAVMGVVRLKVISSPGANRVRGRT